MLVADGILVDRGIGLGSAVVGRRNAVTGFTAVVAVPVVNSAVWVLIYTDVQKKEAEGNDNDSPDKKRVNHSQTNHKQIVMV